MTFQVLYNFCLANCYCAAQNVAFVMRELRFIIVHPLLRGHSGTKPLKQGLETFGYLRAAFEFQQNNAGRFRTGLSCWDKQELFEIEMRCDTHTYTFIS